MNDKGGRKQTSPPRFKDRLLEAPVSAPDFLNETPPAVTWLGIEGLFPSPDLTDKEQKRVPAHQKLQGLGNLKTSSTLGFPHHLFQPH